MMKTSEGEQTIDPQDEGTLDASVDACRSYIRVLVHKKIVVCRPKYQSFLMMIKWMQDLSLPVLLIPMTALLY